MAKFLKCLTKIIYFFSFYNECHHNKINTYKGIELKNKIFKDIFFYNIKSLNKLNLVVERSLEFK